jgi:uncharacterized YccA/Bax inhibitor family protein
MAGSEMRSSNPVLTRLAPTAAYPSQGGYRGASSSTTASGYPQVVSPSGSDVMTIDDVVVRTVGLLLVTAISGALAWALVDDDVLGLWLIGAAMVGLVLGLIISFARITNPALILTYAVVEGVFVGLISKFYETLYAGIVIQAAVGTFGVFFTMAALYKFKVIRATPRFTKGVIGAVAGLVILMLATWVLSFFGINTGLRGDSAGNAGWLAIGFSIVCIIVAALTFILDFDQIERAARGGMPRKTAWTCAFGLLVGLIWVYLEILRLLSYLRR